MNEEVIKLSDLQELLTNKYKYRFSEAVGHQGIPDDYRSGVQGEYNERIVYYKHPSLPENIFMKETYQTDSYGDSENLEKVEFVKGTEKTIKVFEPIN